MRNSTQNLFARALLLIATLLTVPGMAKAAAITLDIDDIDHVSVAYRMSGAIEGLHSGKNEIAITEANQGDALVINAAEGYDIVEMTVLKEGDDEATALPSNTIWIGSIGDNAYITVRTAQTVMASATVTIDNKANLMYFMNNSNSISLANLENGKNTVEFGAISGNKFSFAIASTANADDISVTKNGETMEHASWSATTFSQIELNDGDELVIHTQQEPAEPHFTVDIDDIERISGYYYTGEPIEGLTTGINYIYLTEENERSAIAFRGIGDAIISEIKVTRGDGVEYTTTAGTSIWMANVLDGGYIRVKSEIPEKPLAFTVNIDKASNIQSFANRKKEEAELKDGENTVRINQESTMYDIITVSGLDENIVSLKLNGTERNRLKMSSGAFIWTLNVEPGDVIDIVTVGDTDNIGTTTSTAGSVSTVYYDINGRNVAAPEKGNIYIKRSTMADGSVKTEKITR